eukprot:4585086-Pyramimonas_sp.AAC.1
MNSSTGNPMVAAFACGSPPGTALRGTHRRPQPKGSVGGVRMRFPHPVQRFVTPEKAPPKALVAVSACVSPQ